MGQITSLAQRLKSLKNAGFRYALPVPWPARTGSAATSDGPAGSGDGGGSTSRSTEPRTRPQPFQPDPAPRLLPKACSRPLTLILARSTQTPGLMLISCYKAQSWTIRSGARDCSRQTKFKTKGSRAPSSLGAQSAAASRDRSVSPALEAYTSVSIRSRSIRRTLHSTAARLVICRAQDWGNQPRSPSLSLSPQHQPRREQSCSHREDGPWPPGTRVEGAAGTCQRLPGSF